MSTPSTTVPVNRVNRGPMKSFKGHKYAVQSIAFFPDGKLVVTGADDGEIRLWDVATGMQVGETLKGHSSTVLSVAISKDGRRVASGGMDGRVVVWDAITLEVLHSLDAHSHQVRSVDFSPDGQLLASGSFDDTARIWSVEDGTCIVGPLHCDGRVYCTKFSPNGSQLATRTRSIQIWDQATGNLELVIEKGATSLAWSRDGSQIIASSLGKVTVYDARIGSRVRGWAAQTSSRLLDSLSLSPCGNLLAGSSEFDDMAYIWNIRNGRQVAAYKHRKPVNCIAYSPAGTSVATACDVHNAYLWATPQNVDFETEADPEAASGNSLLAPESTRVDTYSTCSEVLTKTEPAEANTSDALSASSNPPPLREASSPRETSTSVSDPGYVSQPPKLDTCMLDRESGNSGQKARSLTTQDIFKAFFKKWSRSLATETLATDNKGRQKLKRRRRHGGKVTEIAVKDQVLVESARILKPEERQKIRIPSPDELGQSNGVQDTRPPHEVEKMAEIHGGHCGLRCF